MAQTCSMAQVLSEIPETGYSYEDELPVSVRMDGDPYEEQRTKLALISRRRYTVQLPRLFFTVEGLVRRPR